VISLCIIALKSMDERSIESEGITRRTCATWRLSACSRFVARVKTIHGGE